MTTNSFPQPFSPWPRWVPPLRVTGVEWTRHVGGRPFASPAAKPRA